MNKQNFVLLIYIRWLVDERIPFLDLEICSKTSEFTSCVSEQLDEILKGLI